jgi:hypothetical protein
VALLVQSAVPPLERVHVMVPVLAPAAL